MLHVYYSISDLLFDKGWTPDIMRFYLPDISLVKASYFFGKARYRVTHKGWDFRDDFRNLYCLFPYICNSFAKSVNKPFKDHVQCRRFNLKGVFAKNERGYRHTAKNKRFWSLLILVLSVTSIRRKLFITTHDKERSVHTNSESCNIQLGSQNNLLKSKQII